MWKLVVTIAIITQLGATDCGQVLRDPGFDLWCGESLCAWKIERGTITRVATWHEADAGVALGDDSAIEQLAPVNSLDGDCITFDLVANIDDNAEVYLNVDIEGDGTLEMHERLPSAHWKPLSYSIALQAPYDGIRFELTKAGNGNAVLAQIGASTSSTCGGLTRLDPGPRPDGAACVTAEQCKSGLCVDGTATASSLLGLTCGGCDPAVPCANANEVCGIGVAIGPILAVPLACVPKASAVLGERCLSNAECASNICNHDTCSACDDTTTCPSGQTCNPAWGGVTETVIVPGPFVCGGGEAKAAKGAACGTDDDCLSSHCTGTPIKECPDARPCVTNDQCPVDTSLTSTTCTNVGVSGGSCD